MQTLVVQDTVGGHSPAHEAQREIAVAGTKAELLRLPVTLQPHRNLLKYYLLSALMFGPAALLAALPLYFRYRTLRYDVDGEGITMRWGILFRREVSLTYARIQDIQLTSNLVERWLGLARVQLQTASGSSTAEMTIEGVLDVESMRDFLYARMRGTADAPRGRLPAAGQGHSAVSAAAPAAGVAAPGAPQAASLGGTPAAAAADIAALTAALDAAAAELRALRADLAAGRHAGGDRV
jgi:membrane protein YdbS with pleckstrin-like domain